MVKKMALLFSVLLFIGSLFFFVHESEHAEIQDTYESGALKGEVHEARKLQKRLAKTLDGTSVQLCFKGELLACDRESLTFYLPVDMETDAWEAGTFADQSGEFGILPLEDYTRLEKKETVSSGKIRAVAEEGASLTVFEVFEPAQAAGQLAVRTELYAKKDSRIRLVQVMMRGEGQELLNDVGCICEENGALDLLQVVVGKGDVYYGIWTELQKDHASLQAEIGYLLQNQQKFDVNLNVRHFGKVTESTIQADGTLMDAAEKIFRGTIDFVRGSADSVGAETEQVLLLGDDVVNKTIPVILCAEENVQGSHGAAIGELDEETLFYFGARGMDRTQAENTMARAKLEAKIQKIGDADIEQKVKTQLAEVLDRDNR